MDLTLQVNNAGYFVNTAVYGDLPDLNPVDNYAGFSLTAVDSNLGSIPIISAVGDLMKFITPSIDNLSKFLIADIP